VRCYMLDSWTRDEAGIAVNLESLLWLEELLAAAGRRAVAEKSESSTAEQ